MITKRRIGEMLLRLKTPIEIRDSDSYKRLTIRINHQGVSVRDTEIGANIGTKNQFRVCAGDFILSKIDARQGAFGIVPPEADGGIITGNFWTYRVDNQLIDTEWFLQFTNSDDFLELCKRSSTGNTHRKYLNEDIFLNHELATPSLEEQRKAVVSCISGREHVENIQHEITRQQSLLAKLRQAILQEAIQGELTADWRTVNPEVEPASQLLHRIQAEKARLVAAKKLRPEKPLPKITPAEIPFEIPKSWEWCRFGSYARFERGKFSARPRNDKRFFGGPYPFIQIGSLDSYGSVITSFTQSLNDEGLAVSKMFEAGTIATAIVGGTIGNLGVLGRDMCFTDSVVGVRPSKLTCQDFILLMLRCKQPEIQSVAYQRSGQPNISLPNLTDILIPLPPLAEQSAIVEKVEALMTTCRTLEAEIEHTRTHAAHLLQAVLREAFSGERVVQDANDKPVPAKTNVIPFPVRISNISATDLHAGILARAYQHHEQNPKHLIHFGHVKAEKIAHLVEAHLGIDLERVPVKAAAGPNDYPHLKKVESRARKANWFVVRQQKADGAYVFHKERGFDALLGKTAEALGERVTEVDVLIKLLLPLNTRQAEVVTTLYAAWNNLLLLGRAPSDEDIVYEARENWHVSKLGIEREKFFKGLEWMRKQGLVPVGRGRYVDTK